MMMDDRPPQLLGSMSLIELSKHTVPVAGFGGTSAACSHTYRLPNVKWVVPGGAWLF